MVLFLSNSSSLLSCVWSNHYENTNLHEKKLLDRFEKCDLLLHLWFSRLVAHDHFLMYLWWDVFCSDNMVFHRIYSKRVVYDHVGHSRDKSMMIFCRYLYVGNDVAPDVVTCSLSLETQSSAQGEQTCFLHPTPFIYLATFPTPRISLRILNPLFNMQTNLVIPSSL